MANKTQRLNETYQIRPGVNGQALVTQDGVRWGQGGGGGSMSVGEGLHIYEGEVTLGGDVSKETFITSEFPKSPTVIPFNQELQDLVTEAYGSTDENVYARTLYGLSGGRTFGDMVNSVPFEWPEGSGNFYEMKRDGILGFIAKNYAQSEAEQWGGGTVRLRTQEQISIGPVGEIPMAEDPLNPTPEEAQAQADAMRKMIMAGINLTCDSSDLNEDWEEVRLHRTQLEAGYSGIEMRTSMDPEAVDSMGLAAAYGARIFVNSSHHNTAGISVTSHGLSPEQIANGAYPQLGLDYLPNAHNPNNSTAGRTQLLVNPFLSSFSGLNSISSRADQSDLLPNGSPLSLTGYGGIVLRSPITKEVHLQTNSSSEGVTLSGVAEAEADDHAVPKQQLDARLSEAQRTAIDALDASTATVEDLINALQA